MDFPFMLEMGQSSVIAACFQLVLSVSFLYLVDMASVIIDYE